MTKNQIESKRIEMAGRLNEISGLEGSDFTDAIRAEAGALEAEYRDSGIKLQAALAVEDDERKVAEREAAELGSIAGSPEHRERLEIRSRTGLADFLSAAVAGREVSGAAREYSDACGVSPLGRLPLEIFGNGQPEHRAITSGPRS